MYAPWVSKRTRLNLPAVGGRAAVSVAVIAIAIGCSGAQVTREVSPQTGAAPPSTNVIATEPLEAAQPNTETSAASEQAALPSSPLVALTQADSSLRLFSLDGAVLVGRREQHAMEFGVVQGDDIEWLPRLRHEDYLVDVGTVAGRWPDAVDMLTASWAARTVIGRHRTLVASGWETRIDDPIAGSHPQILCAAPEIVREFTLDVLPASR